jgi:nicotinamide riboside kinase
MYKSWVQMFEEYVFKNIVANFLLATFKSNFCESLNPFIYATIKQYLYDLVIILHIAINLAVGDIENCFKHLNASRRNTINKRTEKWLKLCEMSIKQ